MVYEVEGKITDMSVPENFHNLKCNKATVVAIKQEVLLDEGIAPTFFRFDVDLHEMDIKMECVETRNANAADGPDTGVNSSSKTVVTEIFENMVRFESKERISKRGQKLKQDKEYHVKLNKDKVYGAEMERALKNTRHQHEIKLELEEALDTAQHLEELEKLENDTLLFLGEKERMEREAIMNKHKSMAEYLDTAGIFDLLASGELSDLEELDGDEDNVDIPDIPRHNDHDTGNEIASQRNLKITEHVEPVKLDETEVRGPILNEYLQFVTMKSEITYGRRPFEKVTSKWHESSLNESVVLSPLEYFLKYIKIADFEKMAYCTNLYANRIGKNGFVPTNIHEIQVLFALHIIIGCLNKFPRIRMYWDTALGIQVFLSNMTKDRFFALRTCLHIVDHFERSRNCFDKVYKVRPLYDAIRSRCLKIFLEENLCVDEQMVPFTGSRFDIKQYVKGKPHPWGAKIFVLCGTSGIAYDFIIYQGQTTIELDSSQLEAFGFGASVVLQLSNRITERGCKLFFDHYFSSYHLFQILKSKGILAAGTVCLNRFNDQTLLSDKEMKRRELGFSDEVVSHDGDIALVKWIDSKVVIMGSNFVGKGVEDKVKRWDKENKQYIEISRPEVVKLYNRNMGGVDLFDRTISYHRIFIRSKKWTLRLIMHGVDFALTNSWLEYQRDCSKNKIPENKRLDLLHFRMQVADTLIKVGKPVHQPKSGLQSCSTSSPVKFIQHVRRGEKRPAPEVQFDFTDHMPQFDRKKEATRCKMFECSGKTHVYCDKCSIHLCFVPNRNCFTNFHRKNNNN